jgi:hypothetical protein
MPVSTTFRKPQRDELLLLPPLLAPPRPRLAWQETSCGLKVACLANHEYGRAGAADWAATGTEQAADVAVAAQLRQ